MEKNAFTLIELVCVVLLLGLITLIAFPPIIKQIKKSNDKIDEATEKLITIGTSNYLKNNQDNYPKIKGAIYCIKVQELIDNDNLSEDLKTSDGNNISGNKQVQVSVNNETYNYRIVDECMGVRKDIMTSKNACIINNQVCPNGTKVNVKVNEVENYDFYVIADTGSQISLIMDRNVGNQVAWGTSLTNATGPVTALDYLENQTSNWTNIPEMSYTLNDDGGGNKYGSIIRTNIRSRMLTKNEATDLGCTLNSTSCPKYLYANLNDINMDSILSSYWLSSAYSSDNNIAWTIHSNGKIIDGLINDNSDLGVRPVITLSKGI